MERVYRRFIFSFQFPNFINAFQRLQLYSTSSASDSDSFVNYLVHSLGLSHQQARSASIKISKYKKMNNFQFDSNAPSVVGFFKNHGCDDTLLRKLVSSNPRLLRCKVEKTLEPKFKFFQDQGFPGPDIIQIISGNPRLFGMGLEYVLVPAIQTLRQVLGSDTLVVAALKNLRVGSFKAVVDNLLRNVAFLDSCGIPMELIKKHLIRRPLNFMLKPESFKDAVTRVEQKLGIRNDSPLFMYGAVLCSSFSEENFEAKFRMFKSFGWTQSDIEKFIMRNTSCFTLSEASFKKLGVFDERGETRACFLDHPS